MPRNREDARRRLQQAALELYCERGYDQTTTAEIAARAGVTERTFFRHFPNKREVLFSGEAPLRAALVDAVAEAPAELTPLGAVLRAFRSIEQVFEDNRRFTEPRQRVIDSTPALQERELAKAAALIGALAEALRRRGVEGRLATLAAQAGMAAFGHAVASWLDDPTKSLDVHLVQAFEDLHNLSSTLREADLNVR